ncbi:SAM hydrolase/SAM-dependent halogenase family protein [Croceimicrobium hydrocarbonivorans]|uniref:SAM-dependent chlorinase/fluorinase n=1 Tax=Croceimicrobium hydrocarbonivorans TaxID=2761580 RepID=A0A7H0VGW1_9FLAO|nr:SAM-dependent chlorinase/fluorinase [Croceimicrobium hydrocarbonivorans]QNR24959.1 SAM-dependent chlorinase/fluorinase [Croceimicrobium hydrocarbonivorans]
MALITLSSDYGFKDPYRAMVHGVLATLAPELKVLDLSHSLGPGNLIEAAFVIGQAYSAFPPATVHLILCGELAGDGRWLAMELDGQYFIAADNGVLSLLQGARRAKAIHRVEIGEQAGTMFPGRDFLSKAAVHLAQGGALSLLGKAVDRIKSLSMPKPNLDGGRRRIQGHVIYVDNYGNLITNLKAQDLSEALHARSLEVHLPRNRSLSRIAWSYQDNPQDGVLALINSLGLLEIAYRDARSQEVNGASSLLGLGIMSEISISYE